MVGSPAVCLVPVYSHWGQPVAGEQMAMDPYLAPTGLGQGLLVAVWATDSSSHLLMLHLQQ